MSLGRRALVAVLLTVAFYALALGLSAGLLAVPIVIWLVFHQVTRLIVVIDLAAVLSALVVLVSIVPRRLPPPPPALPLDPAANDRLFGELREVARLVGEPMPAEVALDLDVGAHVTRRGGWLGLGGRRVMVLGLPLLQVLHVTELQAVLAHEFGHFKGGDTRLTPWVYRTNVTIQRTQRTVGELADLLHPLFSLYARLFQRVTMGISRRQEVLADELAARTVGAGALLAALETIEPAAVAFGLYWPAVARALRAGCLPPVGEGFASFLALPSIAGAVDAILARQRARTRDERYDSHPPLAAREQALRALPSRPYLAGEPVAISLLDRVPELEARLVAAVAGAGASRLRPIAWADVGERVVRPAWQRLAVDARSDLAGVTADQLPLLVENAERIGRALARAHGADAWLSAERAANAGLAAMEAALGLTLARRGWRIEALPGLPVTLSRDGVAMDLHEELEQLASGRMSPLSWRQWCGQAGIAGLDLDGQPPS